MFGRLAALVGCTAVALSLSAPPANAVPITTVLNTVSVDVDGDGAVDTVEVLKYSDTKYLLQVTTATRVSGVFFTSTYPADWGETSPWFGAAKIDKAAGYDLLVYKWGGDGVGFTVYTWRSGALVSEKAPAAPLAKGWYLGGQGYRFFNSKGKRYVDVSHLTVNAAGTVWSGKIIRSVWSAGKWKKISTRTVKLSTAKADPYIGFNGAPLIVS
jgi:hypothetical protein